MVSDYLNRFTFITLAEILAGCCQMCELVAIGTADFGYRSFCIWTPTHYKLNTIPVLKGNHNTCRPSHLFSVCDALMHILTQMLLSPAHTFGPADLPPALLSVSSHPSTGKIKPQPTWTQERPTRVS